MRHLILSLLAVLLAAPALSATENDPAADLVPAVEAEVVPSMTAESAPDADGALQLTEVTLEERAASDDAAAAQLGPRGGFWWLVGVVVVAGVILAILL